MGTDSGWIVVAAEMVAARTARDRIMDFITVRG